jgi:hypothetical protein
MSSRTGLCRGAVSVASPISALDMNRAGKSLIRKSMKCSGSLKPAMRWPVELEWRGILVVSGDEFARRQRNERFLTFREGKIVSQRNYDCYPPFGEQPRAGPSAGLFAYE